MTDNSSDSSVGTSHLSSDGSTTQEQMTGVDSSFGDQDGQKYVNTQDAPYMHPENQGEEDALGGTTSDPRSDDDTLAMAHRGGSQTTEDSEHPQPVDLGRDIDQAEQKIKES